MRKDNWPALLNAYLLERINQPFKWGINDCCLFVADWIVIATGTDPAKRFRGKYKSKRKAYSLLNDYSGGGVVETIEKLFGEFNFPEITPALAGRGDVGIVDSGNGDGLGVVGMDGLYIYITGIYGLDKRPVSQAIRAWRIN